jgi:hypothetical protein
MEAGTDFEEGADAAVNLRPAGGGASDAGKDFEEGGLAGAVAADEAEDFAFADFEGDILQRPEGFFFFAAKGSDGLRESAVGRLPLASRAYSVCRGLLRE